MDGLREMLAVMTPEEFRTAARERELEEWREINRFCGKCGSGYNGLVGGFAAGDRGVREMRIKVNLFLQLLGNGLVQGAGAMLCAT